MIGSKGGIVKIGAGAKKGPVPPWKDGAWASNMKRPERSTLSGLPMRKA